MTINTWAINNQLFMTSTVTRMRAPPNASYPKWHTCGWNNHHKHTPMRSMHLPMLLKFNQLCPHVHPTHVLRQHGRGLGPLHSKNICMIYQGRQSHGVLDLEHQPWQYQCHQKLAYWQESKLPARHRAYPHKGECGQHFCRWRFHPHHWCYQSLGHRLVVGSSWMRHGWDQSGIRSRTFNPSQPYLSIS